MANTKDLTKGSYKYAILSFALPIFISNLFQQLYSAVDSLIVGKFIGTNALAAVSSSGNLLFLFQSFFIGTASGASVIIAKYFGEKNYEKMDKAIHTDIALGLIFGIILTFLGYFLSPWMLKIMNTDSEVLPESISYFQTYFLGMIGVILYNVFNGILNALGNSKKALHYLIISSVMNVGLDLLFVGIFKKGVAYAALATAISQIISCLHCFLFLIKKGTIYQVQIKKIKIHKEMLFYIIKYGVPSGIQNSVIALANVFVQSNTNSFGKDVMAGCGTYSKLEGFAFLPVTCFTMALTTFVGQNLGAKQYERAKKGSLFGIICSISLAELIGLIMFIFSPLLASLFTDDEAVIAVTTKQCRTICLFYFLLAFSHCVASICRGAGKAIIPMGVMIAIWCIFRMLYIKVAMLIAHELVLIFIAYPLTWFISSIIYLIYYLKSDWVHGFEKKVSS